jgi:hypothetical protein
MLVDYRSVMSYHQLHPCDRTFTSVLQNRHNFIYLYNIHVSNHSYNINVSFLSNLLHNIDVTSLARGQHIIVDAFQLQ